MTGADDISQRDAPRLTPWELVFGAPVFDAARFEDVRTEAEHAGARDASDLFMLPAAGEVLRSMTPPGGGPEAVAQVRTLIYAAYRFWLHGCNVYHIPESVLRDLITSDAGAARLPLAAGYVQLPRNVLWARIAEDGAPEPLDGFFWSVADDDPDGPLELLFALGIRPGRPGLSLFDVRLESTAQLESWGRTKARGQGDDFANVLPGGELQRYLAVTTGAEALKLAALCLDRIDRVRSWTTDQRAGQRMHEPDDG